ncbi:hypothetical protein lerEdw1_006593 [Lerista edwardsae]|nr:hypothetical protein lerEdw1_006593 [Lerista edwardsae]
MDAEEGLLRIMEELPEDQLRAFVFYLGNLSSLPSRIPRGKLSGATRVQVAELIAQHYPGQELDVTAEVLRKIPRMDLLKNCERTGGQPPAMNAAPQAATATPCEPHGRAGSLGQPRQVSDKELMMLAKNMGKNWKQIAIEYLGMKMSRLEQIEEDNPNDVVMRAFYVLLDWRNHEGERATAAQLYVTLNQKGVPLNREAYSFLLENA